MFLGFRVNGSLATPKQEYAEFHITANVGYEPPVPSVPPKTLQFPSALQNTPLPAATNVAPSPSTVQASEDSLVQELDADDISESFEAVDGICWSAIHCSQNTATRHFKRDHKDTRFIYRSTKELELPESEFASVIEPSSMIRPPRPPKPVEKRQTILTIVAGQEGQELTTGALHNLFYDST